ncbi:MAG: translation initiation factor IF-2, partial [Thermoproteota archaeon]
MNNTSENLISQNERNDTKFRQPIVAVLGHVDSGKTTLLDYIRKTRVTAKEPGSITQHIGASEIPASVLRELCKPVFSLLGLKFELKTKGLLFIDLPGHEAFTNLRRRGGSVADIAILVIDALAGIQPQTKESINILRERRTPFVVALNKIDLLSGWKSFHGSPFIESFEKQSSSAQIELEKRLSRVIDQLAELGFEAERYDRVRDFTKVLSIVPTSAITGEGVPDLLAMLLGLVQRFMLDRLKLSKGPGLGTVLEVKEEPGLGTVLTAIIYDGAIRRGDTIVVGGKTGPIVTSVRALLRPKPLVEIRVTPKSKFQNVEEVKAAAGIMIAAPGLDAAIAGSPLVVVRDPSTLDRIRKEIREEIGEILISTDKAGIIVKADTLGSLEALVNQLKERKVPIRKADIGDVTKKDIFEAAVVKQEDEKYGIILAFNVKVPGPLKKELEKNKVALIEDVVIYGLIEKLEKYLEKLREEEKLRVLSSLVYPCELEVLPGYVFRRSNPAIVGIRVLKGRLRPSTYLLNERGKRVGIVMEIQDQGVRKPEAIAGQEVAISIRGGTVGRNIKEGQILYSDVKPVYDPKARSIFFSVLSEEEKELYQRILDLKLSLEKG